MSGRKKLVAGNWKMNGLKASLAEIAAMKVGLSELGVDVELAVCPPATLAAAAAEALSGSLIALGGQDCHSAASGAFTGDISASMWADLGATYIIVGHSERRSYYKETDAVVAAKAAAVLKVGLTPIICLGETLQQRDAGETLDVISTQLAGSIPAGAAGSLVIAYEPVWAIGTGRTPTLAQVEEAHGALRKGLSNLIGEKSTQVRILYGGSVKPENAAQLLHAKDVDGALVGGASLKASDFLAIARGAA